jgi:hypothetical protein
MDGLGRLFNVVPKASGIDIPLKAGTAVTFVIYEDGGDTQATVQEGIDGASNQDLDVVDTLYYGSGVGGVWGKATIATPLALIQKKDHGLGDDTVTSDAAVICVDAAELSAGYNTVQCTVDAGECIAILHDLTVQRAPENLAALV